MRRAFGTAQGANRKQADVLNLENGDDFFSRAVLVWSDSRNISPTRLTTRTQRHEEKTFNLQFFGGE